jgi:hypothetical protein
MGRPPKTCARRWCTTARSSPTCSERAQPNPSWYEEEPSDERSRARQPPDGRGAAQGSRANLHGGHRGGAAAGDELPDETNRIDPPVDTASDGTGDEGQAPLFDPAATEQYQARWRDVQTDFVDDPRAAVSQADQLVAELMQALASTFTDERAALEGQWDTGTDVSTEELRIAMRRYRSFFSRLLTI